MHRQARNCEYKFYTEFQSHEPEFDYLKSIEIEEKINRIKWCKRQNNAHFLLSTNGTFALFYSLHHKRSLHCEINRQDSQIMEGT